MMEKEFLNFITRIYSHILMITKRVCLSQFVKYLSLNLELAEVQTWKIIKRSYLVNIMRVHSNCVFLAYPLLKFLFLKNKLF